MKGWEGKVDGGWSEEWRGGRMEGCDRVIDDRTENKVINFVL